MRRKSTNIMDQMVDMILSGEKSGVPAIDAQVADALEESRMALPAEREELLKAKRVEGGSKMISPEDKSKLLKRKEILNKMRRPASEVAEKAGKGILKGIGRKAAGLAIGGPLALASEMADASEIGTSEDDKMLESTEYTPEQKEALKRGIDMKRKLLSESGDVSQDPVVLRAKAIAERLQQAKDDSMTEEMATERAMRKRSPQEQMKILKQMRDANRRK